MAKDIVTKAEILGGEIDVRANFGQTVKATVSPDPYMGDTEVTPSAETQVLATKKKFVQDDITVYPAPTEALLATLNGTFTPSDGKVGFSAVNVDVNPDLRPLSVSENGSYQPDGFDGYSDVTVDVEPNLTSLAVTENGLYLPESGVDGFDRVNVDVPVPAPVLDSLSVTENGTYVPSAGVDGFEEVVVDVPTGGGGGLTLIDTIDVNGGYFKEIVVNPDWFDGVDILIFVPYLTFSTREWLYVNSVNSANGIAYWPGANDVVYGTDGYAQSVFVIKRGGGYELNWFVDASISNRQSAFVFESSFFMRLYYASSTMTGSIKVYGIKIPT